MTLRITRVAILLVTLCACALAQTNDINLLLSTLPAGKDPQRYKGYVEPQFTAITHRAVSHDARRREDRRDRRSAKGSPG